MAVAPKERNRRAKITMNTAEQTVTFLPFANGSDKLDGREFIARLAPLPDEIKTLLALDRLRNKLMDSYSDKTKDVIAECRATYDNLLAGTWAARGESAERNTLFIKAYASLKKLELDAVRARVNAVEAGDDDGAKALLAQLRANAQIKAEMSRISVLEAQERAKTAAAAAKAAPKEEIGDLL